MRRLLTIIWFCVFAAALAAAATPPRKVMSLSYNPSGLATFAALEKGVSEEHLRTDLKRIAPYTLGIRTYSLEYGLDRIPAIARELGLKVSLGIQLGKDPARNAAEVKRGIALIKANTDVLDRVYVGNEAVLRGDLPAAEVARFITQVRAATGAKIPFGTAEPWHVFLKYPELGSASDFIGAHLFPSHDGLPTEAAVDYLDQRFTELARTFPSKPVVIAETGWQHTGMRHQASVPSDKAQADYTRTFIARAAAKGYVYNLVEAYDQPWKAPEDNSALWGIFTDAGKPKFDF